MKSLLIALAVCASACASFDAPTFPAGAVPLDPVPSAFRALWADVEQCSGRRGDFDAVDFFIYPDRDYAPVTNRTTAWDWRARRIYLTRVSVTQPKQVRYGMLRYQLPGANTEPPYYVAACAALIE